MTVRVRVEASLLEWAVDRAGWTEETLARRAPHFEAWVTGARPPTLKQLEKFAHDTHAPLGLLFLPEPPDETVPIPDMRTVGNRDVRRPSADLLDTIYACQLRQDWYREYATTRGLPEISFAGQASVTSSPETVAARIREMLGFELDQRSEFSRMEEALRRLIDRIEQVGVLVMVSGIVKGDTHRTLDPEEFRGFALFDPVAPVIFVNAADTKAAQIFTIVHELAHIWLGGSALSDAAMAARAESRAELWCNAVAAEMLVPLSAIQAEYRGIAVTAELERLARKYKVSTLVVLKRLYDAHFLGWDDYEAAYAIERNRVIQLASSGSEPTGGDYYVTQPLRLSRKFARAVIADTLGGGTAYRDAYSLLGTRKYDTFQNLAIKLGVG